MQNCVVNHSSNHPSYHESTSFAAIVALYFAPVTDFVGKVSNQGSLEAYELVSHMAKPGIE